MAIQNLNSQEVSQVSGGLLGSLNLGGLLGGLNLGGLLGTITGLLFGTPATATTAAKPGLLSSVLGLLGGLSL